MTSLLRGQPMRTLTPAVCCYLFLFIDSTTTLPSNL